MPRLALALAALLALAGCAKPAQDWPAPKPALWEVTGPGGAHGWLFGTIHSLPDGAGWRTAKIDRALTSSDVLVVEIANLGDKDAAGASFRRYATTPGLPPLSQRVPATDRPALAKFLADARMGDGDFPETETWAAALILANRAKTADSGNGVDRALIAAAPRVVGLETFDGQYAAFDRLAPADQVDLLMALAGETATGNEDRQVREWLTGDLAALERDSADGVLADPALREQLQVARTRAWSERIAGMLASGRKPFVAVGTAHMWGDDGLVALLGSRGYTVTRVE